MKRSIQWLVLLAALTLTACATAPSQGPDAGTDAGAGEQQDDVTTDGAQQDGATTGAESGDGATATAAGECPPNCDFARGAIDDPGSQLSDRTIYFEFDSSKVQAEYMDIVRRHAAYLTQYPDVEVRLEGHTDERGSREYNVGLGARRAESVGQLLQAYGVSQSQIETVSYGEEVPAVEGSNEEAWAKNRRVELVYPASGG